MKTDAEKMLYRARAKDNGRADATVECATSFGTIVVTWDRISKTYDVGTVATSHVKGKRSDVLPALEALFARGKASPPA